MSDLTPLVTRTAALRALCCCEVLGETCEGCPLEDERDCAKTPENAEKLLDWAIEQEVA